jgi:hypothetical protein
MKKLGIKHLMTTAFHPQSNGLVERTHRRLKEALKARLAGSDWPSHLPWLLLGLRAAPREDSGLSVAELLYGAPLSLPGRVQTAAEPAADVFGSQLRSSLPCVATRPPPAKGGSEPAAELFQSTHVYVRSPPAAGVLCTAYRGPYEVIKRTPKFFILKIGQKFDAISVDRLKPHTGGSPPATAEPPRRGRPKKN